MKHQTCKHAGRVESFQRSYTNERSEIVLVECHWPDPAEGRFAPPFLVFGDYCEECREYEKGGDA